jgi:hypothetical protein
MAIPQQMKQFLGQGKIDKIENLVFENDILINGFPRTGMSSAQNNTRNIKLHVELNVSNISVKQLIFIVFVEHSDHDILWCM